ncbi:MAG: NAD(P)/FAD-dependent oxidoreductase [Owenweeksia sp.]|nr:NAD(P)/FAD-dependent oxidoreductase [Owenweeksia sp.]
MTKKKITIAGAGLVGSLLACYLGKRGHQVKVFERRPDMRKTTQDGGRSINLALSDRGWKALAGAGLKEVVENMAIPMRRRVMHDANGEPSYQPYGQEGQAIYSVSRAGLNALLMDEAEHYTGVSFHFDQACQEVDFNCATTQFQSGLNKEWQKVEADLLFGTDGAFSAVRTDMQKTDRFNYSQHFIEHGYKELSIPPKPDGSHRLEREALHIWPRGNFMLIALPNPDGSFTCTLFLAFEGKYAFDKLQSRQEARSFFEEHFADALKLMDNFDDEWEQNPVSSLVIIRCYPWSKNGKVALLGDASHAIVPFYGQGMNSGFEDCTVLGELMDQYGDNWPVLLAEFEQQRKPDADAIADLAMRNFVEMRDLTGQPEFLLRKKIEARFASRHPDKWIPLYSMVTFSHIRYSKALAEGERQDAIMEEVMRMPNIEKRWDSDEVEQKMIELIESN